MRGSQNASKERRRGDRSDSDGEQLTQEREKQEDTIIKSLPKYILEKQKVIFYNSRMINRSIIDDVYELLQQFPVVAVVGPRQVGKTTLAKQIQSSKIDNIVYLDLELPSDIAKLSNPELFLESHYDDLVIIDEIQRMPDLFPVMRALVDKKRQPGRFLILGSANLGTITKISQSLAGRISYIELPQILRSEVSKKIDIKSHWLRGGYPEALLAKNNAKAWTWLNSIIRSYVERDLPLLGFKISSMELRRFWTMLAHNHGQLWNAQQLASNFGVSPPTATHYRSILEQMFLVRSIEPWHANIRKRMVKSPCVYIRDSGILHTLLGIETIEDLMSDPIVGKSWEGFVIEQIIGELKGRLSTAFFRTHAGAELDMVLYKGQRVIAAIEIKLGLTPKLTKGFHNARSDLGDPPSWVIYSGKERYVLANGVEVIGLDEFIDSVLLSIT